MSQEVLSPGKIKIMVTVAWNILWLPPSQKEWKDWYDKACGKANKYYIDNLQFIMITTKKLIGCAKTSTHYLKTGN